MNLSLGRTDYVSRCHEAGKVLGYALRKRYEIQHKANPDMLGLTVFDADKTMRLCDKLWEKHHEVKVAKTGEAIYPLCIDRDYNDKHGQRVAFPIPLHPEGDAVPVLEFIENFDKVEMPPNRIFSYELECKPWGNITYLVPQIGTAEMAQLKTISIDKADFSFLDAFGSVAGQLTEREIIAIGRHETPGSTRDSLQFEFNQWLECCSKLLKFLAKPDCNPNQTMFLLWQLVSYAYECYLKSGVPPLTTVEGVHPSDRFEYESGYGKINSSIDKNYVYISNLFRDSHSTATEIWDNVLVSEFRFPSFCCFSLGRYLFGALKHISPFVDTKNAKRLDLNEKTVLTAFKHTQKCISISYEDTHREVSDSWLTSVANVPLAEKMPYPNTLRQGSCSIEQFIDVLMEVIVHVNEQYVRLALSRTAWGPERSVPNE